MVKTVCDVHAERLLSVRTAIPCRWCPVRERLMRALPFIHLQEPLSPLYRLSERALILQPRHRWPIPSIPRWTRVAWSPLCWCAAASQAHKACRKAHAQAPFHGAAAVTRRLHAGARVEYRTGCVFWQLL